MPIPNPEPGLVILYAYLWHREHQAGREEGRKGRPSVIVLSVEREATGGTSVIVLPITHSPPTEVGEAVEIPLPLKRHLGLDDERSWVVVTRRQRVPLARAPGTRSEGVEPNNRQTRTLPHRNRPKDRPYAAA